MEVLMLTQPIGLASPKWLPEKSMEIPLMNSISIIKQRRSFIGRKKFTIQLYLLSKIFSFFVGKISSKVKNGRYV